MNKKVKSEVLVLSLSAIPILRAVQPLRALPRRCTRASARAGRIGMENFSLF